MAANRYGRIHHGMTTLDIRFPSAVERQRFADEFVEYHASHDHDGEVPSFEHITASEANKSFTLRTYGKDKFTIDGYKAHEILEYHEAQREKKWTTYSPPTCCVPPIIAFNRSHSDLRHADKLRRHDLSAIFGNMPADDFKSLLVSVERDGFIDDVIRIHEGKVLDGWHRYRAARELNLLRKLKFHVWDEGREGDPKSFVLARNIERRHLSAQQRAQIVVSFNERFEKGDIDSQRDGTPNGEPKTREKLAKEAGVGTSTIDRAIVIEKEGESEAVIAGEKTAGEVLKARDASTAKKRKQQVLKNLWDIRKQAATDYVGEGDTEMNKYLTLPDLEKGFVKNNESYAEAFQSGMKRIEAAVTFKNFQDRGFEVDEFGNAKVDMADLEAEHRALMTYAGDIRQWQRPDWSPDTNWILPLIEAKKAKASDDTDKDSAEVSDPDDLKTLREQVKAQMPKYKQWYKDTGYKGSDLVSRASFSQLIHVLREYRQTPQGGAATIEELKDLLQLLKSKSYPLAHKLQQIVRPEQSESDTAEASEAHHHNNRDRVTSETEPDSEADLEKAMDFLMGAVEEFDNYFLSETTFEVNDYDRLCELASVVHECDRAILYQIIYEEDLPEHFGTAELRQWGTLIKSLLEDVKSDADWLAKLRSDDAGVVEVSDTETTRADDEPTDSDEDTSLTEIDNLPAVKHFLETLLKQVGQVKHPIDRDNLSVAVFDLLGGEEFEGTTEQEQLSILIDCAHSIVAESM